MKNLKKFLFSLSLVITTNLITLDANAFDNFITVKFKKIPSTKFIKNLNKMTNTTVVKLEPPATYVLEPSGIPNKYTMDRYSELFSIMKNVLSVSPVPKDKLDDKINPHFYINNSTQDNSVSTKANPDTTNDSIANSDIKNNQEAQNDSTQSQNNDKSSSTTNQSGVIASFPITGRDVKVTFKIGEEKEAMEWFNEVFGTQLVSKNGYSIYILRFPGNINVKMVVRALKVCSSVSNVEISSD